MSRHLRMEDLPRWYSLSFEKGSTYKQPPFLVFLIWEECVDGLVQMGTDRKDIVLTQTRWKFKHFQGNLRDGFGFDGAFTSGGTRDGYLMLRAELTIRSLMKVVISIQHLFQLLRFLPTMWEDRFGQQLPGDPHRSQLIDVSSHILPDRTMSGAPFGGTGSIAFAERIEQIRQQRDRLIEVEEAMWLTWRAVAKGSLLSVTKKQKQKGPDPYPYFTAGLKEKGGFFLSCIGNATDVGTEEYWNRTPDVGHDIGCHNLDSPIQQLSLIAGLAALCDLADQVVPKAS